METTQQRRMERQPSPPPLPPKKRVSQRSSEEDFEATLGSLVNYYATLPPGALEASVRDQQELETDKSPDTTRRLPTRPRMRIWPWILGGACSMVLGGVITFALIVGRPDFWRVVEAPNTNAATKVMIVTEAVSETEKDDVQKGIPQAEPLKDPTTAPAEKASDTSSDTPEIPKFNNSEVKSAAAPSPPEVDEPVKATKRHIKRARKPIKRARRARKVARKRTKASTNKPSPAKSSTSSGDEWEDPYQ